MPGTLTGFCPEDSLVPAVHSYSRGTMKALCNPCNTGTVTQPRLVDRMWFPLCLEQPSADESKGGVVENNIHI